MAEVSPPPHPTPVVKIRSVEFGPAPRNTCLPCVPKLREVTYQVPAGILTTLCVALREFKAFWIDVAFAEAAPDPAVREGCVLQFVEYVGMLNPALDQLIAREESRNVDQFCACALMLNKTSKKRSCIVDVKVWRIRPIIFRSSFVRIPQG